MSKIDISKEAVDQLAKELAQKVATDDLDWPMPEIRKAAATLSALSARTVELEAGITREKEENRLAYVNAALEDNLQDAKTARADALRDGFIAGATAVHNEWVEADGGHAPRGGPDFSEAASDYAGLIDKEPSRRKALSLIQSVLDDISLPRDQHDALSKAADLILTIQPAAPETICKICNGLVYVDDDCCPACSPEAQTHPTTEEQP